MKILVSLFNFRFRVLVGVFPVELGHEEDEEEEGGEDSVAHQQVDEVAVILGQELIMTCHLEMIKW